MGGVMLHLHANTRGSSGLAVGRHVGPAHLAGVEGLNPAPRTHKDKDSFSSTVSEGKTRKHPRVCKKRDQLRPMSHHTTEQRGS